MDLDSFRTFYVRKKQRREKKKTEGGLHNSWFKALGGARVQKCDIISRVGAPGSALEVNASFFVLFPGAGV